MKFKRTLTGLALTAALGLALAGCSAGNMDADNSASPDLSHSLSPSPSMTVQPTDPGNDAMEGGGAGGTNDLDNDGWPDNSDNDMDGYNPGGTITGEDGDYDGAAGDSGRMSRGTGYSANNGLGGMGTGFGMNGYGY